MKTKIFFLFLLTFSFFGNIQASDPVYLEVISNIPKTINYSVGIYPDKLTNQNQDNRTFLPMYIINEGTTDLVWTRMNHILIVLKDNSLVYNYNTDMTTENYSCAYIVFSGKGFHEQTLCFDGKFTANDIANIYLLENGDFHKLTYYKAK